mmetsp:Transcript_14538/g.26076  ORF Transcript_14538/g.26076 Transcript_14538/m.26076 type:complete len:579 (-) Transcript_14538:96-1832(-)
MALHRLSPVEMGKLNPLVPEMLRWIKVHDEEAGDCFLGSALFVDDDEVHTVLTNLLQSYQEKPTMSPEELAAIMDTQESPVWARSVHTLFSSSEPRIIPDNMCALMDKAISRAGGEACSGKNLSDALWPLLSSLNASQLEALQELCTAIKDTSMDPEGTAIALARSVLTDNGCTDEAATGAKNIMRALVLNAEQVFRSPTKAHPPNPPPKVSSSNAQSGEEKELRQALTQFFAWRDPSSVDLVDKLFDNYHFHDLAQGLFIKYGTLPPEFAEKITELTKAGSNDFKWFDQAKVPKTKRFSLLPAISRLASSKPRGKSYTQVDRVIDEIIKTETTYNNKLGALQTVYLSELRAISSGKRGKGATRALGLNANDVERIATKLENILEASTRLLDQLNVVGIVAAPTKTSIGRAGLVAQIFIDQSEVLLTLYGPYVSSHMAVIRLLKEAVALVQKTNNSSSRKLINKKSFDVLWYELSDNDPVLKGHTLESVLIKPVQRVPQYKLLLESLIKKLPNGHPSAELLQEAKVGVMDAARRINEAVKQHMKLESFFGSDVQLSPNNSIVRRDASGNFEAIVNSYV